MLEIQKVIGQLKQSILHHYNVKCSIYYREDVAGRTFYVGCCVGQKIDHLDELMARRQYLPLNIVELRLQRNTTLNLKFVGRYQIINGPLELK